MSISRLILLSLMALVALFSHSVLAHGMDLKVQAIGPAVMEGTLRFSDGSGAGDQYIQLQNLSDPSFSTLALQTDAEGKFMLAGVPEHRYRITAEGDEGHSVSVELVVKAPKQAGDENSWPPLYLIIVGALLLSLIPAYKLRMK